MTEADSTRRLARAAPLVAVSALTSIALVSAWHSARPTWDGFRAGRDSYAHLSADERIDLAAGQAGVSGELFRFLADHVQRGDRVYFQVPRRPYGTLDLHDTVAALGRFYLLPAVEVADIEDATIVVSYETEPRLPREPIAQFRHGSTVVLSRLPPP